MPGVRYARHKTHNLHHHRRCHLQVRDVPADTGRSKLLSRRGSRGELYSRGGVFSLIYNSPGTLIVQREETLTGNGALRPVA